MSKPRMTKSEKEFMSRIHAIVFATPEVRNGQNYLDRQTFAKLPELDQKKFLYLLMNKTR
jgi:hypothetical protein